MVPTICLFPIIEAHAAVATISYRDQSTRPTSAIRQEQRRPSPPVVRLLISTTTPGGQYRRELKDIFYQIKIFCETSVSGYWCTGRRAGTNPKSGTSGRLWRVGGSPEHHMSCLHESNASATKTTCLRYHLVSPFRFIEAYCSFITSRELLTNGA